MCQRDVEQNIHFITHESRVACRKKRTYMRRRPLRFTCPDSGASSLVSNLILPFEMKLMMTARCPWAHKVDFPAPFAPTIAILESRLTSKLTWSRISLSGVYPNVTSDNCKSGAGIFSMSGNLSKYDYHILILNPENEPECLRFFLLRRLQIRQLCTKVSQSVHRFRDTGTI